MYGGGRDMEYDGLKVGILKAPEKVEGFERSWVRLPPGPL